MKKKLWLILKVKTIKSYNIKIIIIKLQNIKKMCKILLVLVESSFMCMIFQPKILEF